MIAAAQQRFGRALAQIAMRASAQVRRMSVRHPMLSEQQLNFAKKLSLSASLEISPRQAKDIDGARAHLQAGTMVSVTWMPGDTDGQRVATAIAVRRAGFEPVPHLAARRIQSRQALTELLRRMRFEADVSRVFVVGGDLDQPSGPFDSAYDVIASGALEEAGIGAVGITDYPEGHPAISNEALAAAYGKKRSYASELGLDVFSITQFSFSAAHIQDLLRRRRVGGDTALIRIGLAGPASLTSLMKFATMCGVGTSMRALSKHGGALTRMLTESGPEGVLSDLVGDEQFCRMPSIGMHLFVFGGFLRTAAWLERFQRDPGQVLGAPAAARP